MALTGNPLLKLLVVPVVIGAILIGVSMMVKKESAQSQGAATPTVTSEEAATLGIDGDTPADTLRTIVAESRQLKDQISKVIKENDSLKAPMRTCRAACATSIRTSSRSSTTPPRSCSNSRRTVARRSWTRYRNGLRT